MSFLTPNNIIVLLLAVQVGYFYALWFVTRRTLVSFYKAFDIVLLTGILFFVFSRLAGLAEAGIAITSLSAFTQILDLRLDYFVMLFVPAIAFEVYALNFDRMPDWRNHLGNFLLLGKVYVIAISVVELLRAYMNKLPVNHLVFHAATIMVLLVISLFIKLFVSKKVRPGLASLAEILITFGVTALLVLFGQVYGSAETTIRLTALVLLMLICALTALRLTKPERSAENAVVSQNRI